jgi:putative endopeptidase
MTDSRSGLALDELSAEIRPQDDLFRHVNGAWLDRTEIPEDKARWGSFHLIAEQAEKDVLAIVEETRDAEPGTESRKIGDLYTSFMDTDRINELGAAPLAEQLARADAIDSIPALLRTLGELERDGIGGLIGLFVEPDPGNPQRYVPFLVQGGLSLPDESYYRLENFDAVRTAYPRTHRADPRPRRVPTPQHPPIASSRSRPRSPRTTGTTSRAATRSRPTTSRSWDEVTALAGSICVRGSRAPPRPPDAFAEVERLPAELLRGTRLAAGPRALEDWKAWLRFRIVHALPRSCPTLRRRELRVLRHTAHRCSGQPRALEARCRPVRGRDGRGDRPRVRRAAFPAGVEGRDGRARRESDRGVPQSIAELEWMTAETRERALAKLDAFTPKIGYPSSGATTPRSRSTRSTSSAMCGARTSTSTTGRSAASAERSTATSGT